MERWGHRIIKLDAPQNIDSALTACQSAGCGLTLFFA